MRKERLEAFSDGVLAIIITIMVLELKVPHGTELHELAHLAPVFCGYVLSFAYVGIYWNNHHHLMHAVKKGVSGAIMWANLHLLFWLSLLPFATGWAGENPRAAVPAALYGVVLLASAIAWLVLQKAIMAHEGHGSVLQQALGSDAKGKISPLLYATGIGMSFVKPWISELCYAAVAAIWLVPDKRIERKVADHP